MSEEPLDGLVELVEGYLLGEAPSLTRRQVAEQAGVSIDLALELWRELGFAHVGDDVVAFAPADVEALRMSADLREEGVLSEDRQAALVRTWGRSFARLAEWQTALLVDLARERELTDVASLAMLADQVLPRVEYLQTYVWRRHLLSATNRGLVALTGAAAAPSAVCFVDIVGYTSRSKSLTEEELVAWLEEFEDVCTALVVERGGRVIKTLGDAVLFVADTVVDAAHTALAITALGADAESRFPQVRAGLAYGEVVSRLGDVFGPTVNIASRLTSIARPDALLVDESAASALREVDGFEVKSLRRTSVKGYSRLQPFVVRPARDRGPTVE
ncbi:adenylate/guanylate cyclase domain-containing protein [Nocardioides sp. BP30]|uniref:adenylate/guanylate cyclase domain-containing protein n=1 Tax=Nocardioides sp. BP30 TaxID=3036374 RepID=UPI00246900B1|nr:adenylate/guanylate cyclase domain-containing protein [Nocardioides sp. BP30]WGL52658.1 adenylate/guanylate cyclase domain-containing protein [Nocardioides sp. BP30]